MVLIAAYTLAILAERSWLSSVPIERCWDIILISSRQSFLSRSLQFHHSAIILQFDALLKGSIFWDMMPCSSSKVNLRFGGKYRLHLQGRRINRARDQRESRWQIEPVLKPEFGGDMFFRNVGWLSTEYTALYPIEDSILHNHRCDNLKSYRVWNSVCVTN
jgi:hypothetical protein